jgi:hypothetical protein
MTRELTEHRRQQYPEGSRVRAVHFRLDGGLRIWPVDPGNGKWRIVEVSDEHNFVEVMRGDQLACQRAYPDAVFGINDNETVPPGTEGTVRHVDDFGGVRVDWDNGSSISAQPTDSIEPIR